MFSHSMLFLDDAMLNISYGSLCFLGDCKLIVRVICLIFPHNDKRSRRSYSKLSHLNITEPSHETLVLIAYVQKPPLNAHVG